MQEKEKTTEDLIFLEIEKYREVGSSTSDINTMMNCRKNISILCAYYTTELNIDIYHLESSKSKRAQVILEDRILSPSEKIWKIEANVSPNLEKIAGYEIAVQSKKNLLKSFYEITNEISQRVSKLKIEYNEKVFAD